MGNILIRKGRILLKPMNSPACVSALRGRRFKKEQTKKCPARAGQKLAGLTGNFLTNSIPVSQFRNENFSA
jgi:hypothetical protein